ncbi:MAG TPA: diacylglycerol kinase family protein [Polyangiaceae bacterium]|jgi:YegS/Rv2252/BmrU family lipid kinase|nr:diacylglycerol kinase family protein [Polyangiaceae bacterium]
MKLGVIVNPTAGSGSARRRLPEILAALERAGLEGRVFETKGPGHARELLGQARELGLECVAVVGGDGTLNEVAQAYLGSDGQPVPGPDLALIPSGTGGDFRRTFGLGTSIDEAVTRLAQSPPRPVDLGIVELTAPDGQRVVRSFLNITSFGLGGLTDRLVSQSPKFLGGKATFLLGAVRGILAYRNAPVRIRIDGQVRLEAPILNVALANGKYFGGGMKVAPEADPSDGLLDVVAMVDLTRAQGIALAQHIYRGSHVGRPGVSLERGAVVEAEPLVPGAEVLIDLDGETPGRLPLRARLAKGAVNIRV